MISLYNELYDCIICPDCLSNLIFKFSPFTLNHCKCKKLTFDCYSKFCCYLYIKNSATLRLQFILVNNYCSYNRFIIFLIRDESVMYFNPLINIYKYPFEYLTKEEFVKTLNEMLKSIYKIERNLLFV